MFADQSVTIAGSAVALPRVSSEKNSGTFKSNDGLVTETVSHTYGRRNRRMFRLDHSKVAPDPLISSTNIVHSMGVYLVVDTPLTGYTVAQQKEVIDGLIAQLNASSGALITKFLGGEN
jgi:hypothetical protein